jgi:hypothetical protein
VICVNTIPIIRRFEITTDEEKNEEQGMLCKVIMEQTYHYEKHQHKLLYQYDKMLQGLLQTSMVSLWQQRKKRNMDD